MAWANENGYKLALLTASEEKFVLRYLSATGLDRFLSHEKVRAGLQQAKRGAALQELVAAAGVGVESVTVVDDSLDNLDMAKGAGCRTIWYRPSVGRQLATSHLSVESFPQLLWALDLEAKPRAAKPAHLDMLVDIPALVQSCSALPPLPPVTVVDAPGVDGNYVQEVYDVIRQAFPEYEWTAEAIEQQVFTASSLLKAFEIRASSRVIGLVTLHQTSIDGRGRLHWMAVMPQYRRRYIGSALVKELAASAATIGLNEISLSIDSDKVGAIRMYETLGFTRIFMERP